MRAPEQENSYEQKTMVLMRQVTGAEERNEELSNAYKVSVMQGEYVLEMHCAM